MGKSRNIYVLYGPAVNPGSDYVVYIPGTSSSFNPNEWLRSDNWPEELKNKILVWIDCVGKTNEKGQARRGYSWKGMLPAWVQNIVGWLSQLAHNLGVKLFMVCHSRGSMWGSYLLHRHPEWFAGALLCGGYPLKNDDFSAQKAARQLLQCTCKVVIVNGANDEFSNIGLLGHQVYWSTIYYALQGYNFGERAPTVLHLPNNGDHANQEARSFGKPQFGEFYEVVWQHLES